MAGSVEAQQVGYGFKPTDEQLVGHFLKKKLKGEMEACSAIPELYIYDWEPPDLFILYDGDLHLVPRVLYFPIFLLFDGNRSLPRRLQYNNS